MTKHTPTISINHGGTGGSIYVNNCHHSEAGRIEYTFPNASNAKEWQDCQEAMLHIEKCVNAHEDLVVALGAIIDADENSNLIPNTYKEKAKQALKKAGAL